MRSGDGVGLIGAGDFARATLIPSLRSAGFSRLVAVASQSGVSAARLATQEGFEKSLTGARAVIADPDVQLVVVATRHDSHEAIVTEALAAGKHVFCEKPLTLTVEGLERVAQAWRAGSGQLMVGFNRRHSPALVAVRKHLGTAGHPLVITYRVSAGRLPRDHWYHDRRQGGRVLGEVRHFVDTCSSVVGRPVVSVFCAGSGEGEALLTQDVVVSLRYADGSVATISYASSGHASTPKERLEVLGRGRSALVDDFRLTLLDGRKVATAAGDKGHAAELRLLRHAIHGETDGEAMTRSALETTASTLAAVESLLTGAPVTPLPV